MKYWIGAIWVLYFLILFPAVAFMLIAITVVLMGSKLK
jgi:hypothetical protein